MGIPEKIKAIQDEIHKTQINKATEHHIGLLKAKISRLKKEMEGDIHGKTVSSKSRSGGYSVRKTGDGTVVLIGLPSVGKSTLLNRLTNANSKVGSYKFTTITVVPGIMEYRGARIQILDMPGIIEGAASGRGLGKRVLSVARSADMVLLILDVFQPQHIDLLKRELSEIGIKVDQKPPDVLIEKTETGGISVNAQVKSRVSESLAKDILRVYGVHNCRLTLREPNLTDDQLIDLLAGNRVYVPSIVVLNKIDLVDNTLLTELRRKLGNNFIPISADGDKNIESVRDAIFQKLDFIRVFLKPKGQDADLEEPLIVRSECTVSDVCTKIRRTMTADFKYAQVWGNSVKFSAQKVGLDHRLADGDIVSITKRN
ncbi:MAG: OBG GTPase family GTP-binding protein [Nitrososphaeraceae archaeon]